MVGMWQFAGILFAIVFLTSKVIDYGQIAQDAGVLQNGTINLDNTLQPFKTPVETDLATLLFWAAILFILARL